MQPTESVKRMIVPLTVAHVVEITPPAPFNFDATLHKPDHFPTPDNNRRFAAHPRLGPVITHWRGTRPLNTSSLYEYLMIAIVLQNATVRRSVQMMRALDERYGMPVSYDGKKLYVTWAPEDIGDASEEELRGSKVGYRAKSIMRVTEAFVSGQVDETALRNCRRAEQRQALLALYGVGLASVEYILSDVFHHHDAMVHISPWEQKIYSKLFFDRDRADPAPVPELLAYFNAEFAPHQMLAVHYFWEDLFWRRKYEAVPWLEESIRL